MNIPCKKQGLTWRGIYKVSGASALAAGALFLAGFIDFIATGLQLNVISGPLSPFGNNWLVTLFKLHAEVSGVQLGQLYVFNLLDIAIIALVAMAFLGLYITLVRTSKVWSLIALVQPFLGMAIFIMTGAAGRSALMGAMLVISLVMLRSNIFGKDTAYAGIMASVFLLAGDLSVGFIRSGAIAILMGFGYVLLMVWLFRASQVLFRQSASTSASINK